MSLFFSIIVPVFNRPEEVQELLESLEWQSYGKKFEVVVVEDGSANDSSAIVEQFKSRLQIAYFFKENTGPGDSRNYGMERAKGDYFIILDSDCVLPPQYLEEVDAELQNDYVHCFGGPDAAHESFSLVQKAISYTMTSFFTTGGIRGGKKQVGKFQPRSFNMGISREAFLKTGGFGKIHPGEDPDLTFRIWKLGYQTRLFPKAFVFHKRRVDWGKFYNQVWKFGMVRPILNKWHPNTAKPTYWFPTFFIVGLFGAMVAALFGFFLPIGFYLIYFGMLFFDALIKNKNGTVAFMAIFAAIVQFVGYGLGFLKSTIMVNFSGKKPENLFPKLFFEE